MLQRHRAQLHTVLLWPPQLLKVASTSLHLMRGRQWRWLRQLAFGCQLAFRRSITQLTKASSMEIRFEP